VSRENATEIMSGSIQPDVAKGHSFSTSEAQQKNSFIMQNVPSEQDGIFLQYFAPFKIKFSFECWSLGRVMRVLLLRLYFLKRGTQKGTDVTGVLISP
jgi:hypothetical protein